MIFTLHHHQQHLKQTPLWDASELVSAEATYAVAYAELLHLYGLVVRTAVPGGITRLLTQSATCPIGSRFRLKNGENGNQASSPFYILHFPYPSPVDASPASAMRPVKDNSSLSRYSHRALARLRLKSISPPLTEARILYHIFASAFKPRRIAAR